MFFAASSGNAIGISKPALIEVNIPPGDLSALIEAIDLAHDGQADVINLSPKALYVVNTKHNDIEGANGLPEIKTTVTINGNGATIMRHPDSEPFRLFYVFPFVGNLTLNDLTITGGMADASSEEPKRGGAILNDGALQLNNSLVNANTAPDDGGGIFNDGTLILTGSHINGNMAGGSGGGIYSQSVLEVVSSVVNDNEAGVNGGGIYNDMNRVTVTFSTISNNEASGHGGGIHSDSELNIEDSLIVGNKAMGSSLSGGGGIYNTLGEVNLLNSTISGNLSNGDGLTLGGGGVLNDGGGSAEIISSTISNNVSRVNAGGIRNVGMNSTMRVQNSIIAGNMATNDAPDCQGNIDSKGYNLIGNLGTEIVENSFPCNLQGETATDIINPNPGLGTLADNGGSTRTHALLTTSPAIDAVPLENCTDGTSSPLNFDQRGTLRPLDGDRDGDALCDIGAYELSQVCGDVNGDGIVEAEDMSFGLMLAVGLTEIPFLNPTLGDLDRDGDPTVIDAVMGLKRIVGGQEIAECGPI